MGRRVVVTHGYLLGAIAAYALGRSGVMLFTELLGPTMGNLVNFLVLFHVLALAYWIVKTIQEGQGSSRTKSKRF